MSNSAEKLYTLVDVARMLGVQRRTVRYWVVTGKLPAMKRKPSRGYPWLVCESDLEKFKEDRENGNRR